jgi:ribosome-binding factor A
MQLALLGERTFRNWPVSSIFETDDGAETTDDDLRTTSRSQQIAMTRNRQARRAARLPLPGQHELTPQNAGFGGATPDRKSLQLCRQVEQTLSLVLSGECNDEVLQSLLVDSVVPAPNASQLLVTVRQTSVDDPVSTLEVLERLAEYEGQLRFAVASAVTRKRAPKLLFQVL